MNLLPPEAETALLQQQANRYVQMGIQNFPQTQMPVVTHKEALEIVRQMGLQQFSLPQPMVDFLEENSSKKNQKKKLRCPEHGNELVPSEDVNVIRCTVVGCNRIARRKVPVKAKYETGQKYQMPEVLPQPSEADQYAAFLALVTLPVEAEKQTRVERGKSICARTRRLNRMADWQLRPLKEPVFSGADE